MAPKTKELAQPIVTPEGERVIPGTRRPDGTIRKERKVRDGYTPQEEQPVYQSRAVLVRQNVPVCPGMDDSMLEAAKAQAASKAAKKNEKRKEKKGDDSAAGSAPKPPAAAQSQAAAPKPSTSKPAPAAASAPAPEPVKAEPEDPAQALEKAVRALRKKMRQAEALVEKQGTGAKLTAEEVEKAGKLPSWGQEVEQLEAQLAKLKAA